MIECVQLVRFQSVICICRSYEQSIPSHPYSLAMFMSWCKFRITYRLISVVFAFQLAVMLSPPFWEWMNDDEEEDTVRFRQRLTFVMITGTLFGLIQLKNTILG